MENSGHILASEDTISTEAMRRIDKLNETAETIIRTETQRALLVAQEAYALSEECNYTAGTANALLNLGRANRLLSRYDEALGQLEEAMKLLKKAGDTVGITSALNNIGHIYNSTGRSHEALKLHIQALQLSRKLGNVTLEAHSLIFIGNAHRHTGNHGEALQSSYKAYDLYKYTEDLSGQSFALNNIGNSHQHAGNYAKALEFYLESFSLKETTGDNRAKAVAFNNIGGIYFHLGDFTSALDYYEQYLELERIAGDPHGESIALGNIGSVYHRLLQYDLALEYFHNALKIAEEIGDKRNAASCLSNLGKIHIERNEIDKAYQLLMTSIQLLSEIGDSDKKSEILTTVAQIFVERNDPEKGLTFAKEALKIAEEQQTRPQMYKAHLVLSKLYQRRKDFEKALKHHERFHTIKNDLYNEDMARKTRILEINYNLEDTKKEAEIYRLKNVELVHENERLNTLIEERNDLMAIVAHDLKNPLTGIMLSSSLLESHLIRMDAAEIKKNAQNITRTSQRMKSIITQLLESHEMDSDVAPFTFKNIDLSDVVRSSVEDYREAAALKDISLAFSINSSYYIRGDESILRLIVDNILSNAIKYSPFGKKVTVEVQGAESSVYCSVKDEGPGITEEDKPKLFLKFARLSAKPTGGEDSTGLGLSIIKKFTEAMNGKVWCESAEGNGATFAVEFPIKSLG